MRFTPDCLFISFDVNAMFTNIPAEKAKDIMYEILIKAGMHFNLVDEFWRIDLNMR